MDYKTERMIYQISETRNKILEHAEIMFIEEGLFETTMSNLAQTIGISRTSLYRYYRDKLELSLAIVVKRLKELNFNVDFKEEADRLPDGFGRVGLLLKRRWLAPEYDETYRFFAEFDAYYSGSRIPQEFRVKMDEALTPLKDLLLEKYIREGQKDGSIRTDLSDHLIHEIVGNGIRSFHQRLILRGSVLVDIPQEDLEIIMDEYHKVLMDGIKFSNGC
ncbi:MAG: TetR/AcrR family transcriptional regulator [Spirochaetales bacterium]|nr:TetR/AcrR family transcriptional regulator [Spirochaetales bacterium]